jgi:hypothetical protein
MSDRDSGKNQGTDSCKIFSDLGDTISAERDNCDSSACAAAAYFAASSCYSKK